MRGGGWRHLIDGLEETHDLTAGWSEASLIRRLWGEGVPPGFLLGLPEQATFAMAPAEAPDPVASLLAEAARPHADHDDPGQPDAFDVTQGNLLNGRPEDPGRPLRTDGPSGAVIETSVRLDAVPTTGAGVAFGDTFKLHSQPGSQLKVYLDFDGHTTTGTQWNTYFGQAAGFYSAAFSLDGAESFTEAELLRIQ
jgi:hypothetical protein